MSTENQVPVAFDRARSLAELESFIQQQEQELGPLVTLANDGSDSLITFEMALELPGMVVELAVLEDEVRDRSGFELIAVGDCFVGNSRVKVGAFRPVAGGLLRAPAADPVAPAPHVAAVAANLGKLSIKYETGGRGPETVSTGSGDAGGVSYGSYQMTSLPHGGTVIRFVTAADFRWRAHFAGLTPGAVAFTARWREIAAAEPQAFHAAQHEFIKRTHFDILVRRVRDERSFDAVPRSAALQDVIWSTAVQHGPNAPILLSAMRGLSNPAGIAAGNKAFDRDLIIRTYDERGRRNADGTLAHFSRNSPRVQRAVAERFVNEKQDALAMLGVVV